MFPLLEKDRKVVYKDGLMKNVILTAPYLSRKMGLFLFGFGFLLLAGTTQIFAAESQLVDRIVAVVNSEVITESELDTFMRQLYEQYKTEYSGDKLMQMMGEARMKLLNQLIEDRLVLQEAKSKSIEIKDAEIDETMADFKTRFKSDQEMEAVLKDEGISLKALRERFEKQGMIRRLQDQEVRAMVVVSPTEIDSYYEAHPEEFTDEERIKVRSITIKKNDEAKAKGLMDEEAKNKMLELRKKIVSGEDFGKLAKDFSDDTKAKEGGMSDWVKHGEMIPVIDSVIFALPEGRVSEIIETPLGYHLFRVEERQKGSKKTLEQSRDAIYNKIFKTKAEIRFQEWMTQLKKKAYISIR